jgi:hypothetical protein
MLWNAQISRVKKFFLIILFSGGAFVIMAGILRAYFILSGGREGGAQAAYWGTREVLVAFIIGNVPMISGGLRIWVRKLKKSQLYTGLRSRTKNWPGANMLSALLSGVGRSHSRSAFEKGALGKDFANQNAADRSGPPSQASCQSPQLWRNQRSDSRADTSINRSDTDQAYTNPRYGIRVTQGIRVDVESRQEQRQRPRNLLNRLQAWLRGQRGSS